MTDNNPDKEELCKTAYTMGYDCFEHSYTQYGKMLQESENPMELWTNGNEACSPISDLVKEGQHTNSYQQMIWKIEDKLGFDSENEDWDNQGIYGYIEDCATSWESGAYHALMGMEYKPESLPFVES